MDIRSTFPQINEIKDESLMIKTMDALEKAIILGNWAEKDLENIPFTLSIPKIMVGAFRPMISLIDHINAVTKIILKIYDVYSEMGLATFLDRDALISGALLHDVGKFVEYEKGESGIIIQSKDGQLLLHQVQGMEIVAEFNLPCIVKQAIAFHSSSERHVKLLPEVEIINYADSLCVVPIKKIFEK